MTQEQTTQKQHCHCHQNAAEQHEQAAKHHKEAAKCHESGDSKMAVHHAHIAQGHSIQANECEAECCKQYSTTQGCCKKD